MPKSTFNRIRDRCASAAAFALALPLFSAQSPAAISLPRDYCRNGRPVRVLTQYFEERIPRATPGTPLDVALRAEQVHVERIRAQAKATFVHRPPEDLAQMMETYTFLVPGSLEDTYGLGGLVAMSEISLALKYRKVLWRNFIEQSSTVREAPSSDPNALRFEVTLDLSFFCRYRQRTSDLVTR